MFLKDDNQTPGEKAYRIAASDSSRWLQTDKVKPITPDGWRDYSTKVDGYWVVFYDEYTRHHMGAVRSKDLQNWEIITDSINFHREPVTELFSSKRTCSGKTIEE
jgi:hypothetical protein